MIKKKLDITQVIKNFEDEPFKFTYVKNAKEEQRDLTLKDVILYFIRNAHKAPGVVASGEEEHAVFDVGSIVGRAKTKTVTLTSVQYDAMKKLLKANMLKENGVEYKLYATEAYCYIMDLYETAETIKD